MGGDALPANYAYDALYRAKQVTNGLGYAIQYSYDSVGNPTLVTYPSLTCMKWGFDADSNVNQRTDPLSRITNYALDPVDSDVDSVGYPTGTGPQFQYDMYGRLTSMTHSTGSFSWTYDDNDLLLTATTTYTGLLPITVSYGYYPDGSRQTISVPAFYLSGEWACATYTYSYQAANTAPLYPSVGGRLLTVNVPWEDEFNTVYGVPWQPVPDYFLWDRNGRIVEHTSEDIFATGYIYDARGRLSDMSTSGAEPEWYGTLCWFDDIQHDAAGNLTSYEYSLDGLSGNVSYSYDNLDRLTGENRTVTAGGLLPYDVSFGYDSAGNPQTVRNQTFTFNEDNQTDGCTYDSCGNCEAYRDYLATYDYEDLPASLIGGATAVANTYRADGLRASKTANGSTTYFIYDGERVLFEMDSASWWQTGYAYGPTGLFSGGKINFDPLTPPAYPYLVRPARLPFPNRCCLLAARRQSRVCGGRPHGGV